MVESSDMKKKILIQNDPKLSFGDISQKFRPLRLAALTRGLQRWGGGTNLGLGDGGRFSTTFLCRPI